MDDQASELELEMLEYILSDATAEPIKFSSRLMRSITDNFSIEIGRGGFGVVYKGVLRNGDVAVKKLTNPHTLSEHQFLDEITCLRKAKHRNIVRFLGYCSETQGELLEYNGANIMAETLNKLLCFEYVPSGNVEHYLKQEKPQGDSWHVRYKMIRGICEGLRYLHDQKINHLDLKPENVMLDAHMEPKITDFGLSRCLDQGQSKLITQHILGTPRYIAPEIIDKGEISYKSDIYALGIIIIELLTGISRIGLENWDESLDMDCPAIRRCVEIARNCTEHDRHNRPTILEVVSNLDDLEIMIPNYHIGQVTRSTFPGTDMVDVYPVELRFPFEPNEAMLCHLSLTNKYRDSILMYLIIPEVRDRYTGLYNYGFVEPMHTTTITLCRQAVEELPSETDKLEVLVFNIGPDIDTFKQQTSTCFKDTEESFEEFFKEVHELVGYELHRTLLTAVVVVAEYISVAEGLRVEAPNQIYSMDVHPTEPWLLVVTDESSASVAIFNWETCRNITRLKMEHLAGPDIASKLISRKQWAVVGDNEGVIHVLTIPGLDTVHQFKAHKGGVSLLEVHPNRSFLLSCSTNSMKLWDWSCGWSCTGVFDITNSVTQAMFNPKHTNTFTTRDDRGKLKMWKFDRPYPIARMKDMKRPTHYKCLDLFTYSGNQHFIAAFKNNFTWILDLQNNKLVHALCTGILGEKIVAVVCDATHGVFVTFSASGEICVWDSMTYRLKKTYANFPDNPIQVGFTGSRRLVIAYSMEIIVIDIDLE